jgi:hypothetical protein
VFGGAIRVHSIIQMLATFSDVTLLAYTSWSDLGLEDVRAHLETLCERVSGCPASRCEFSISPTSSMSWCCAGQTTPHFCGGQ